MIRVLSLVLNPSVLKTPSPKNLSFFWNLGSFLFILVMAQVVSGILLVFYYCVVISESFLSISVLMDNINFGFLLRLLHLNGASFIFLILYFHMIKGFLNSSFKFPSTWSSGVGLLVLMMAAAFLGYVLPWGQMSFWAATVITKFFSVVSTSLVIWVWSGFSVGGSTLKTFFSLHYLVPFIIVVLIIAHFFVLHFKGSSSKSFNSEEKINFSPMFIIKDLLNILFWGVVFSVVSMWLTSESENFIEADFVNSPQHIKPEWYFLFAYTILRSIPHKMSGVVLMLLAILVFFTFIFTQKFLWAKNLNFIYYLVFIFMIMSWVGYNSVGDINILLGLSSSGAYFLLFFLLFFKKEVEVFLNT